MLRRTHLALLVFTLIGAGLACNKQKEAPVETTPDAKPLIQPTATQPLSVLDKTFDLKTSATFSFEVPAHSARPHLHGVFESSLGKARGESNDAANIDFVIMNEEQQAAFASNRPSEALFSADDTHNQSVNLDLPPAINQAAKYYLVFQNPHGGKGSKVVQANFRVDF